MNRKQVGQQIFDEIKAHISQSGRSMNVDNFPPDFPISRRSCYNIRHGKWTPELLEKLPFKVTVEYKVKF